MDVRAFLNELAFLFPIKRNESDTEKLMETYVNDILFEINNEKWLGYECNFQYLLRLIRCEYNFQTFPAIAKILEYVPQAMVYKPKPQIFGQKSTEVGQVIKRTIGGVEYEFTVVPSCWAKVKTISELHTEIERMEIAKKSA